MRTRLAVAAAFLCAVPLAAPAYAGDTTAVAINTKDGFDVFKLAFQIRRATGDVVDNGNAAVAYASCTSCQTVAIAIQVVLISGDASTVAPENLALAYNEDCSLCQTLASAYQFVLTAEGNVHFTAEGNQRLADIRKALLDLKKSDLTIDEIQTKLDALMDELADVLTNDLVPAGQSGSGGSSPSPSVSPTPSSSEAPSESVSPSESASPSASETASPSESVTP
jgi:putative peptide zinc metalloprotease protein